MRIHLLKKANASNSDTFGRYKIRKLRGTFLIVILVAQAEDIPPVWRLANQKNVQSLPISALDLADQAHGTLEHHPRYGSSTPHMANGRFVQIQDGFRSEETMGPIKRCQLSLKQPWQWIVYGFQSIDLVKVNPSKRNLASSGNAMPFISTGMKRWSLWW